MVLAYALNIDGDEHASFVCNPNALYLLPDHTLARVDSGLIWCRNCGDFCVGERFDERDWLEQQLTAPLDDEMSKFIYAGDQQAIARYRESVQRTLHFREVRQGPPRCLDCGTAITTYVSLAHGETFEDERGRTISYAHVFASTGMDHHLSLYDVEGNRLGEISRVCPVTNGFIDDAYDYQTVVKLLQKK